MTTLRARVLTIAVAVLAATVGVLVVVTAALSYQRALTVMDEDLQRQLVHVLTEAADRPLAEVLAEEPPAARVATILLDAEGDVVLVSQGPEDVAMAVTGARLPTDIGARPVEVVLGDTTLRVVGQPLDTQSVVVAGEYDAIRTEALSWAALIGSVGLGCLILGAVVTSIALSRAVRPVHELAADTARTVPGDLAPVPVPAAPAEATQLATELNDLLARIRAEQAARNQFLATVSHEMRTPLTIARGHLEALVTYGARDADDLQHTTGIAVAEIGRASELLDAFLTLARSAQPDYVRCEPESLPDLAAELRLRIAGLGGDVEVLEPSAATVSLDRERIGQAVLNCVTNAQRHNVDPVRVQVGMDHGPQWLVIGIDDSGAGWPQNRDRLLQPFESTGSSGLGLAVVDAVARAHGGRVALTDSALGGARVEMWIPSV